jgi:glycosyltransferase involved in cell wall biosynthesis
MPQVSIIIPVYNGARFLGEALESVFMQTFEDYEIICVDDGSTDTSIDILKRFEPRLSVIQQRNTGQGGARNRGVRQSSAPYVAFLDQDDRWYPHKLADQVAAFERARDAVVVYSNSDRMDTNGRLVQTGATEAERSSALASPLGRLIGEGLVLPSSMLVRKDAFERAGGFDPQLRGFEDFDLCARLKPLGRFIFLKESGLCYRVHEKGFSHSGGRDVIRSRERFLVRMRDLYVGHRGKQRIIRSMLADCYSDWGKEEMNRRNLRASRSLLIRSLRYNPFQARTYLRFMRTLC